MLLKKPNALLSLAVGDSTATFLPTGDVFQLLQGPIMVNRFRSTPRDGSLNNLYLRIYSPEGEPLHIYPLLGQRSASDFQLVPEENRAVYTGVAEGIAYTVTFHLMGRTWFWQIHLQNQTSTPPPTLDLVYAQDLGLGSEGSVFTNELYLSQYLGHQIFSGENGYVLCSRQNLDSGNRHPYLQQGSFSIKSQHFSTDGLSFFGVEFKNTQKPVSLEKDLCDTNFQYECAFSALQTERFPLEDSRNFCFYGYFSPDHPDAVTAPMEEQALVQMWRSILSEPSRIAPKASSPRPFSLSRMFGAPYNSPAMSAEEIEALFPHSQLEEQENGQLLSFFTPQHTHIVTKEKELQVQRPHGTILITPPSPSQLSNNLISTTQYMYGVFNSHITCGNTDFHKAVSSTRGFLGQMKYSGQRLYIRLEDHYHVLEMPALFEMGMNYSRWYYKLPEDLLQITCFTTPENPAIVLNVESTGGIAYDFILTQQLCAGPNEWASDLRMEQKSGVLFYPLPTPQYPNLTYGFYYEDNKVLLSDDRIFYRDGLPFDGTFLTLQYTAVSRLTFSVAASLNGLPRRPEADFSDANAKAVRIYGTLMNHFHLDSSHVSGADMKEKVEILNATAWWYTHNAFIHFLMPHGLEQPSGAAWGTRDVCQGPMEYLFSCGNFTLIRQILLNLFSHQEKRTGEWPQWFMFDKYTANAGECHGDVIFWPLKCLGDYLTATGDCKILETDLPYGDGADAQPLSAHLKLAVDTILSTRILSSYGLITYAGGDWDDTLQPADDKLKENMISSWTVALAYQTFHILEDALKDCLPAVAKACRNTRFQLKEAFDRHCLIDQIIPGFLIRKGDTLVPLLHPRDQVTGIHYRLLPMTRSIIAQMADPEQADANLRLIREHLFFPDGVRLMDHPARYEGGVSHLFKRAEQAANIGREISLQYTHAHIRYIEALATYGSGQEAWNALFMINPILIQSTVPNAAKRQSNLYFSSSDGDFADRYQYDKEFQKLKDGSITVKGGWRLYSSGPGIYFHQVISSLLGIRLQKEGLMLDPVLPPALDGLQCRFDVNGKPCTFIYHLNGSRQKGVYCNGNPLPVRELKNPYRPAGYYLKAEDLPAEAAPLLEIYV